MVNPVRSLALVTGASSGIGFELAKCCAENGFDLVVAADTPEIQLAAQTFRDLGAMVLAVQTDLSTLEGVDKLWVDVLACGQPIEMLLAAAGHGMSRAFLDLDFNAVRHVLDSDLTGALYLLHKAGQAMRARGRGRILITGPVSGFMPGAFQAFLDSFSVTLRHELKDSGVTVACLMPGATEPDFDPTELARQGFEAMMREEGEVTAGAVSAARHRGMAEPRHRH